MQGVLSHRLRLAVVLLGILSAAACGPSPPSPTPTSTATPTMTPSPAPTPTPTASPTPTATPTPAPLRVWVGEGIPAGVQAIFAPVFAGAGYILVADSQNADLRVALYHGSGEAAPVGTEWVYAIVAPFPTLADAVAWDDVLRYWVGDQSALGSTATLLLAPDVLETLSALLGEPAPSTQITLAPADALHQSAWGAMPGAWSIVPFNRLRPEWKVLTVDEWDVLDPHADLSGYPLAVAVGIYGGSGAIDTVAADLVEGGAWRSSNRDASRMTTLSMTGVTALTRATAWRMETNGVLYPAQDIAPLLQEADILHISNEVSFTPDCPPPDPSFSSTAMRFCSNDTHFELLTYIGVDVVELTGNHVNDWGTAALEHSLDLYEAAGMGVFGGGRNLEAARAPYITTHRANTFAFVGCNPVGPVGAFATGDTAGAAPCDYEALYAQIAELSEQVDIVVVTQQYWEFDHHSPTAQQTEDFAKLARAGADIVSGSQAHMPQGFAFVEGRFVHYGPGNLFFDQMQARNLREMFIDLHIIYDGSHISTRLFTGLIEDYARPRPMTPDERREFLTRIFAASGW